MHVVQWDQTIKAFSTYRPNDSLAVSIGRRRPQRRLPDTQPELLFELSVELTREDSIPIVDQELLMTLPRQGVTELLEHPGAVGMVCYVGVQDPAAPDVEDHQNVEDLEMR